MSNEWDEFVADWNAKNEPKPKKHYDDEEHRIQAACVRWFNFQHSKLRGRLFAVPNGGRRDEKTAKRLKAEGVVTGVADLILLVPNKDYHALLIEMKTTKGTQSKSQKQWQALVTRDNEYKYIICRSQLEFANEINNYLKNK